MFSTFFFISEKKQLSIEKSSEIVSYLTSRLEFMDRCKSDSGSQSNKHRQMMMMMTTGLDHHYIAGTITDLVVFMGVITSKYETK